MFIAFIVSLMSAHLIAFTKVHNPHRDIHPVLFYLQARLPMVLMLTLLTMTFFWLFQLGVNGDLSTYDS